MYPIKLYPAFKDYIWGGEKLKTLFYPECDVSPAAEAWVLSCHDAGQSKIINGQYKNKNLSDYIKDSGKNVLGTDCADLDFFPVLIKLIDARDNLSVQVHPDDEYALKNENGLGKTEMWYVLDCDEGAQLFYGFNKSISKDEFETHIKNNTLTEVLNAVNVKKGDCFFIPAGTIHAIGKNMLIAEIQQNSNTTYRVYDYGRIGADGKPRDLHIKKALDVTNFHPAPEHKAEDKDVLAKCDYFTTRRIDCNNDMIAIDVDKTSFSALLFVSGSGKMIFENGSESFKAGDCFFVPAGFGQLGLSGNFEVLETRV